MANYTVYTNVATVSSYNAEVYATFSTYSSTTATYINDGILYLRFYGEHFGKKGEVVATPGKKTLYLSSGDSIHQWLDVTTITATDVEPGDSFSKIAEIGGFEGSIPKTTSSQSVRFRINIPITLNAKDFTLQGSDYISVPALSSYTISYNANGGSGAPSNQTKYYDINLTLSDVIPTRSGYTFVNWNTASNGTGTSYTPSGTYTANAGTTLYAQWIEGAPSDPGSVYIGVNDVARKVNTMYVGVNGVARKVTKAYVGVNNVATLIFQDN